MASDLQLLHAQYTMPQSVMSQMPEKAVFAQFAQKHKLTNGSRIKLSSHPKKPSEFNDFLRFTQNRQTKSMDSPILIIPLCNVKKMLASSIFLFFRYLKMSVIKPPSIDPFSR